MQIRLSEEKNTSVSKTSGNIIKGTIDGLHLHGSVTHVQGYVQEFDEAMIMTLWTNKCSRNVLIELRGDFSSGPTRRCFGRSCSISFEGNK